MAQSEFEQGQSRDRLREISHYFLSKHVEPASGETLLLPMPCADDHERAELRRFGLALRAHGIDAVELEVSRPAHAAVTPECGGDYYLMPSTREHDWLVEEEDVRQRLATVFKDRDTPPHCCLLPIGIQCQHLLRYCRTTLLMCEAESMAARRTYARIKFLHQYQRIAKLGVIMWSANNNRKLDYHLQKLQDAAAAFLGIEIMMLSYTHARSNNPGSIDIPSFNRYLAAVRAVRMEAMKRQEAQQQDNSMRSHHENNEPSLSGPEQR